jgi:hypothetical protein
MEVGPRMIRASPPPLCALRELCGGNSLLANPFRIRTCENSRISIKTNNFNLFRINTYSKEHPAHKTKDFNPRRISPYKSFRINTCKKGEGG